MTNKKSLLPIALQDKNNLVLEECIKAEFNIDIKKLIVTPVQNADESLLPHLAKQEHVLGDEGWNLATTKEEKQNLIISSFEKHSKKGSIPSIIAALKNIKIEAKISEFWEYSGRPSHFKVEFLNIYKQGLNKNFENQLIAMINAYKPATRILDYINYFLCSKSHIYISTHIKTLEKTVIKTNGVIL